MWGYGKQDAVAANGDQVRTLVVWKGKTELSELIGSTVRLKIHLQKALLYAFWME